MAASTFSPLPGYCPALPSAGGGLGVEGANCQSSTIFEAVVPLAKRQTQCSRTAVHSSFLLSFRKQKPRRSCRVRALPTGNWLCRLREIAVDDRSRDALAR